MLIPAVASTVPASLATALVAITTLGAVINAVANAINGFVQLRRLEALDRARTVAEQARHVELLTAINSKQGS